ncbi:SusD/RagB family nutrient-binding outer membrane lipoprotein [Dyadobacter fanqingshengii]|uniref:SusD/RagB family nutrient-binding outer membrane lipoprotein n=1 Tax=Dyadobacter fanqingshengii TaxID=2906443 RepID=A0A9X1P650_9BACT|nr:SusD/RagB family nutrient-binding outer membrane lipoprotein [Dyadobacter fanqingshengii]MCF0038657.1 SusD/RagB family nutrient-binding outer membrane lipoprotein [Dyadobacter fanqingshengii]MCF2503811.1 SusD/RagB family nutrient-binding outer membrane lipoprotein [Dyadobacter fanqingshengii]USJ34510.1 SusD/RagB family nutrient-binding outer membrane lipoprotein [Dyadobacter fanqingshengii]
MKFIKRKILLLAAVGFLSSCEKQAFVDINKNPDALTEIPPQNQFLNATTGIHGQDFEAFYDLYRRIMPWMQYNTLLSGNQGSFTLNFDNFANRYGRLYNGVGDRLYDLEQLVGKLEPAEQPRYDQMIQIARILKAYYSFYVSDIYGSIPYSEAFQGRYGGTLQPKYDTQQELFARLDGEIKAAVAALKVSPAVPQYSLGSYDQYYKGDTQKWIKAANALRLRMALRVQKADAAAGTAIITDVLAQPATDLMASNADAWIFISNATFTGDAGGGNWNTDELRAPKPMVDFMWEKSDPRIDAFFTPNGYSQANINLLIAEKKLPAGTTAGRRYVGSFTSPDDSRLTANVQRYYTAKVINSNKENVDTLSLIQPRLFSTGKADAAGNAGTGQSYLPVITYAEYCFMRAEIALKTTGAASAKTWYEAGVRSSLEWYNEVGVNAKLTNYTATTPAEITAYLAKPGIAFDAAKAMDQIGSQSYLNFMKQPQEGWALYKRTGYPNPTSIVPLPRLTYLNVPLTIPRRAPITLPTQSDPNYANKKAAYDAMAALPGFGDLTSAAGRVWWDKP